MAQVVEHLPSKCKPQYCPPKKWEEKENIYMIYIYNYLIQTIKMMFQNILICT
jgi:hypothetical protein